MLGERQDVGHLDAAAFVGLVGPAEWPGECQNHGVAGRVGAAEQQDVAIGENRIDGDLVDDPVSALFVFVSRGFADV
jgi:hypothetical protein